MKFYVYIQTERITYRTCEFSISRCFHTMTECLLRDCFKLVRKYGSIWGKVCEMFFFLAAEEVKTHWRLPLSLKYWSNISYLAFFFFFFTQEYLPMFQIIVSLSLSSCTLLGQATAFCLKETSSNNNKETKLPVYLAVDCEELVPTA